MALIGCERSGHTGELQAAEVARRMSGARLATKDDVERVVANAVASERAIMFIHVDWAPMEYQRTLYAQIMLQYARLYPDESLGFHYVDCTSIGGDYSPLTSIAGWWDVQRTAGASLIGGHGELVWLERGRLLHVEPTLDFASPEEIVRKTDYLMPPKRRDKALP